MPFYSGCADFVTTNLPDLAPFIAMCQARAGVITAPPPPPAGGGGEPFDCPACDLVPCGECQEGCELSSVGCDPTSRGFSSRNGCSNGNEGAHPTGCTLPTPPGQLLPPNSTNASLCDAAGWRLTFADEFASGSVLDNSTWGLDMGWDTLSSLRTAKQLPENVYLEDGALVLRSMREQAPPYTSGIPVLQYGNRTTFNYTSGAVTTLGRRAFGGKGTTTRVCVRAKLPGGGGRGKGKG